MIMVSHKCIVQVGSWRLLLYIISAAENIHSFADFDKK